MRLDELPTWDDGGALRVVVESPAGSRMKLKYEPRLEAFELSRPLVLGVAYPYDWGFVPATLAPDGDPLDAMVIFDAPTYPGVVIPSTPIGVVRVSQKAKKKKGARERNDRLIVVPSDDARLADISDLPDRVKKELEQFFVTAVLFAGKDVKIDGWDGKKAAAKLVEEAHAAWEKER